MPSIEELTSKVQELERRVAALERVPEIERSERREKAFTISEFMRQKRASSSVEKTLFIAYFLEVHDKVSPLSAKDLEEGFAQAREPRPKNLHDMVYKNIRNGYLMEAKLKKGGLKTCALTNSGVAFVEAAMSTSLSSSISSADR